MAHTKILCRKFETKDIIVLPLHTDDRDKDLYVFFSEALLYKGSKYNK